MPVWPTAAQPDLFLQVGINAAIGHPVNRIGISVAARASDDLWSVDGTLRLHFNATSFGPPAAGPELQMALGTWLGYGAPRTAVDWPQAWIPGHSRTYGLGYQLTRYQDRIKTSQWTGTLRLQFGRLLIRTENDAFVPGSREDRYRSGAASFTWLEAEQQFELRTVFWHGDSGGDQARSVRETDYPCRFGYRDFCGCEYGGYSNGVLGLVYHRRIPFGQTVQLGAGIDAEQVRNFVQNRLIHDMWFFPPAWTPVRNLHYPMLTEEGELYLFREGQRIRPVRPFFLAGMNQDGFY